MSYPGNRQYQGVQLYQAQINVGQFDPQLPAAIYTGWADRNSYQTMYNQGQRITLDSGVTRSFAPNGPAVMVDYVNIPTVNNGG